MEDVRGKRLMILGGTAASLDLVKTAKSMGYETFGTIKRLPDFIALEQEYGVEIYHHMEVGQAINEYHTNLDGCGYIIAKYSTVENAISIAEQVLGIIKKTIF